MQHCPTIKFKRRGDRLVKTVDGVKLTYFNHNGRWRVHERTGEGRHDRFTFDVGEKFLLWRSVVKTYDPPEYHSVHEMDGEAPGPILASRNGEDYAWIFSDGHVEFISISECGIGNAALVASFATLKGIDEALAKFIGVTSVIVALDEVEAAHGNPRLRHLIDFKFKITPSEQRQGSGRRAQNDWRHTSTNWEDMLREGSRTTGDLMYPPEYEQIRRGVDRIYEATKQHHGGGPKK